jgi:DNA-binding CsgD family transcriptional regulator
MSTSTFISNAGQGTARVTSIGVKSILDQIDYGMVLVDRNGPIHLNRAARAELDDPQYPLRLEAGRLRAVNGSQDRQLCDAIDDALRGTRRRLMSLDGAGKSLPVAVVPLASDSHEIGEGLALVVLGKRQLCSQLTEQWFCRSHGLTPAESAVLGGLLAGNRPSFIAQQNGVAISTVRTHLASIRSKTATGGIRELMMTAAALPPMVAMTHGLTART